MLTTENGISTTNEIFLELGVYAGLELYVVRLKEAIEATRKSRDG